MRKILPTRRSRLAHASLWCARLGVPVLVIGVLLHRAAVVSTPEMLLVLALGSLIGLVGLAGSLIALAVLWRRGGEGWGRAMRAAVYALVALAPLGLAVAASVHYPLLSDVSTDLETPPALAGGEPSRIDPQSAALQRQAYPDLVTRRFRIAPGELHRAAVAVAEQSGWTLVAELPPGMPDEPTRFQAVAVSPVFGFRDDVALRILPDAVGARLDIRSASRFGLHDLGANARRIRSFFADLDAALLAAYGVVETVEEDTDRAADDGDLPLLDPNAAPGVDTPPPLPGAKSDLTSQAEPPQAAPAPLPGLEALPPELSEIYEDDPPAPGFGDAPSPAPQTAPGGSPREAPRSTPGATRAPATLRPVAGG